LRSLLLMTAHAAPPTSVTLNWAPPTSRFPRWTRSSRTGSMDTRGS
jgi:hypothetical protein